ncbi:MAG: GAF domain-containing protein [Labilithrix sp.]|nr:GAF domain-containing protein [Labilithrix sp.]MBX3222496.1 GAF domain-containing protein [Labilithrix sp.]
MTHLDDLPPGCFEGVVPALLATCSETGVPNATWLSQVFFVDERHIALSCQFFRKTRANLEAHPTAEVLIVDPPSFRQWRLAVRFVRSETSGRTFTAMHTRLQAIASMTGNAHVFALRSADVFEVTAITPVEVDAGEPIPSAERPRRDPLRALARITETIGASSDIGAVVDAGLGSLIDLGYESVSLYLLEESEGVLYALASRGFARSGVGARIALGVGIVGTCAERRIPIRIANTLREVTYGRAVEEQAQGKSGERDREIALPGLDDALSLLAVPLVLHGALFGVLALESRRALAFDESDALLCSTAGQVIAQGIALHQDHDPEREPAGKETAARAAPGVLRVRSYEADDSVFVDGEYLIKGLPGRILWLVLTLQREEGRSTFQNRELRLHPFLKLPSFKDNLETRLLMLQRRLDDKGLALRLHREQRGRLRLDCPLRIELERVPA